MGISFEGITTQETSFTFDAVISSECIENEMTMFTKEAQRLGFQRYKHAIAHWEKELSKEEDSPFHNEILKGVLIAMNSHDTDYINAKLERVCPCGENA